MVSNSEGDKHTNEHSEVELSAIYKWSKRRKQFVHFQSLQTHCARDWEAFKVNQQTFLVVANHRLGKNKTINTWKPVTFHNIGIGLSSLLSFRWQSHHWERDIQVEQVNKVFWGAPEAANLRSLWLGVLHSRTVPLPGGCKCLWWRYHFGRLCNLCLGQWKLPGVPDNQGINRNLNAHFEGSNISSKECIEWVEIRLNSSLMCHFAAWFSYHSSYRQLSLNFIWLDLYLWNE